MAGPQAVAAPLTFWLGTHETHWLGKTDVPLFISRRRLAKRKTYPKALGSWALDSGGFTELNLYGRWQLTPQQYAQEVKRYSDEIGKLSFAAIMDWMCEPFVLNKTGKTIRDHQALTIDNYRTLLSLAPSIPWLPVLQGWTESDYLNHVDGYLKAGHDLTQLPLVGLGSICRRQHTCEAEKIIRRLSREGVRLHGFGFKIKGLSRVSDVLASADSLAWSYAARKQARLPGCPHLKCSNCLKYALLWRGRLMTRLQVAASANKQTEQ